MKSDDAIHIAVAESSMIIRTGLVSMMKHIPDLEIHTIEVTSKEGLRHCMESHTPDILIINPMFEGWFNLGEFKQEYSMSDIKFVSLICNVVDSNQIKNYDESINLFEDTESLAKKISELMNIGKEEETDQESLSLREKEIIGCVVKGMTNKEIAEQLFISVHTVITHRRNISRKLQIHSAAGLTIYAIVNKLVELSDVKMDI